MPQKKDNTVQSGTRYLTNCVRAFLFQEKLSGQDTAHGNHLAFFLRRLCRLGGLLLCTAIGHDVPAHVHICHGFSVLFQQDHLQPDNRKTPPPPLWGWGVFYL